MARYLISFDRGWITFTEENMAELVESSRAVIQQAKDAGVLVFTGGIAEDEPTMLVTADGTVTDGPYPETKELIGGVTVIDVPTREDALEWATRFAAACQASQELTAFIPDPRADEWLATQV